MNYPEIIKLAFTIGILIFVITVSGGLAMHVVNNTPTWLGVAHKYFSTPSDRNYETAWFFRQFFRLFSERMSERWYEAKAYTKQSNWISLLCALGIATVVRYDFFSKTDDSRMYFKVKIWYWKLSFKSRKERKSIIENFAEQLHPQLAMDADGLYQIFIAGENVTWDYMNGDLR